MRCCSHRRVRFYRGDCTPEDPHAEDRSYALVMEHDFPWTILPATPHCGTYRDRFRRGHRALVGRADGAIVFTAWIARESLRVDECAWTWDVDEADAVVYDCVTAEAWRGRGIYPEALRALRGLLARDGIRHLWIYADAKNGSSLRGIDKARFVFRGEIVAWTICGMTRRWGSVDGARA